MKQKKKVTQYDIDKQNIKLFNLEHRLQFLLNEHVILKEKFNKIMREYKESCEILQIKEKEKNNIPQYKKDYLKIKDLEKKKHALIFKLETFKNEHLSIKQTLEEYENKKNKLQAKYDKLLKENNELKNKEEEIDYYINERKIEKKALGDFLDEKIKEETQLRSFFEKEYKKIKDENKNFVPTKKKFDLTINDANANYNINNNIFDFHNLSNVIGSNDGENTEKKNENNSNINKALKSNKNTNNQYNINKNDEKKDDGSFENSSIKKQNNNNNNNNNNKENENNLDFNIRRSNKDIGFNSVSSDSNSLSVSLASSDSENSD